MAELLFQSHINLDGNELQNAVVQNLATAPASPKAGQFYFNTTDDTLYVFNGEAWVDALNQGKIYTQGTGITIDDTVISVDFAAVATAAQGALADSAIQPGDNVSELTNDAGYITGITSADVTEALGYTPFNPANIDAALNADSTNPVQNKVVKGALDGKQDTIEDLATIRSGAAAGAKAVQPGDNVSELTNDAGYITAADLPTKISDLTDDTATNPIDKADTLTGLTATVEELNFVDGVTSSIQDQLDGKASKADFSIAAASADYLTYDSATGAFGAKVDTTVTADSTNLVTSGAVDSAIAAALVGGVIYKGTWDATGASDYSGITLPVKQGYMYLVQGSATIGGVEWNAGDYLMVNEDVEAGGTLTNVTKIDNTESADIVRLNATQTLTNKTIDAASNTISNLATSNFASGVIVTEVGATGSDTAIPTEQAVREALTAAAQGMVTEDGTQTLTNKTMSAADNTFSDFGTGNFAAGVIVTEVGVAGSDTSIPTEQAVREALTAATEGMVTLNGTQTLTNKTIDADSNTISNLETDNFKAGVVQTTVRASASASDTALASEKAVATAVEALPHKLTATNGALTVTGGVCTWTIANSLATQDVTVFVYRASDGMQVMTEVDVTSANIVVKFNSAADIAAGTYKVVAIG